MKNRRKWAGHAIKIVHSCDSTKWNFKQAKTLTDAYEVFRVFVVPALRNNGHDVVELSDINLDIFFSNVETKIPYFKNINKSIALVPKYH